MLTWTGITHSEHLFSPAVLQDKATHAGTARTARLARQTSEILYARDGYHALQTITAIYANDLADHIDRTGTTKNFTWSPPTPLTTH